MGEDICGIKREMSVDAKAEIQEGYMSLNQIPSANERR